MKKNDALFVIKDLHVSIDDKEIVGLDGIRALWTS